MPFKSFRAAFDNWWALFGILTTSLAILNIVRRYYVIGLSPLVRSMVQTYREIFHTPIILAADLLHIHIPDSLKDPIVLWSILAVAVFRVTNQLTNSAVRNQGNVELDFFPGFDFLTSGPAFVRIPIVLVMSTLIWPYLMFCFAMQPKIHEYKDDNGEPFGLTADEWVYSDANFRYVYDIRIVFFLQMSAAVLAMLVLLALNSSSLAR